MKDERECWRGNTMSVNSGIDMNGETEACGGTKDISDEDEGDEE